MTRLSRRLTLSGSGVINATAAEIAAWSAAGNLVPGAIYFDSATQIHFFAKTNSLYSTTVPVSGTPHEPTVAGVVQQVITLDHGSDADHVEILETFNCRTGDPDTADTDLASARFTSPDGNVEVIKTAIIGASAGALQTYYTAGGFTMIHFALRGAGPYTEAAGNTLTALQMVLMKWPSTLAVNSIEIRIGSATIGGGANKRYRQIVVTGYSS